MLLFRCRPPLLVCLSLACLCLATPAARAADATGAEGLVLDYERNRGLILRQGETDVWLGLRGQFRYNDSTTELDTDQDALIDRSLSINRARAKGGGKVLRRWLDVYGEYDLVGSQWLDHRATVTVGGWLDIRVGQWKSEFSRERINSSGKQQLVERSISTYWFTIDRQRGFSTSSRIGQGTDWDSRIWIQALSGVGLNRSADRDSGLLLGRWQWNPDGEPLPFSGSDLERRRQRLSSVALAFVTGDSPCTRFSSDGCGQLPGFGPGSYELNQLMLETAFQHRGVSWEQELHFKRIRDDGSGAVTRLIGGYAQIGSFLNEWWPTVPAALEVVARIALVDPDLGRPGDLSSEVTLGANWFFEGHRNKLSVDVSRLEDGVEFPGGRRHRLRLQWEISL